MKLSELVTVEEGTTLNTLSRSKGEYYATVSGTIIEADVSKATSEVDKAIDKLDLPKGVTVDIAGVAADMEEAFTQLGIAMLAALRLSTSSLLLHSVKVSHRLRFSSHCHLQSLDHLLAY